MTCLDLFAGGGGASLGLHSLGMDVIGIDHDRDACRTHAELWPTIRADLRQPIVWLRRHLDGIWASPPCTAFSMAGRGDGRDLADELVVAIWAEDWRPWFGPAVSPDVWLILPTMETILHHRPRWVAMENVVPTRPVMEACAHVLERHGYQATVCVLSAECYGVPQTRRRCFLMANLHRTPQPPEPTHQRYETGVPAQEGDPSLFGSPLLPWVSMADALGWGTPERPGFTMALGGDSTDTTGGGSGARASLRELASRDSWVYRSDPQPNAAVRTLDDPAPTVKVGHEPPSWVLDRRQQQGRPGAREAVPPVAAPGWHDPDVPGSQYGPDTVRLTVAEAATLQGFPADHPFRGSNTAKFRQIGNAVPPALAAAVAGEAAR